LHIKLSWPHFFKVVFDIDRPNTTIVYRRRGAKGKSKQGGGSAISTQPEDNKGLNRVGLQVYTRKKKEVSRGTTKVVVGENTVRGGITEGTNGNGRV